MFPFTSLTLDAINRTSLDIRAAPELQNQGGARAKVTAKFLSSME